MKKSVIPAVLAAAALAVPAFAFAHGGPPQNPGKSGTHGPSHHPNKGTHGKTQRCKKLHNVGFIVSGTLSASNLAQDSGSNTYSGMISMTVTHTNHHAKGFNGSSVTLTHVVVTFGDGVSGPNPASGTNVHLIGKLPRYVKKCSLPNGTPTFRKVNFTAPSTSGSNVSGSNVQG